MKTYNDLSVEERVKIRDRIGELYESRKFSLADIVEKIKAEYDTSLSRERCRQMYNVYQRIQWKAARISKGEGL